MKKLAVFVCAALAPMLLTACAQTPDSVKSETKSDSGKENSKSEIEYIDISGLADDYAEALTYTYSQFEIADTAAMDIPESISTLSFKQVKNFQENSDEIFSRFFDEETLASVEILRDKQSADGMISDSFSDSDKQVYCCVGDNGFICFTKPSVFSNPFSGGNRIKIYHVDRNDDLSDSYTLNGEDVTISEASEYAQKWLDENYADLEPSYEITVKTIIVRQDDLGEYSYDIYAQKSYNGILLDSLVQMTDDEDVAKLKYATQTLFMQMVEKDDIASFTNGNGIIEPENVTKIDTIASLTSTLGYLEKTFTDFESGIEINDINLKYTLTPQNDESEAAYHSGIDFESSLVWEIVIDVPEEDMPTGEEYSTLGDVRKYIYVDTQTGEMDFEFDISVLMQ